MPKVSYGNHIKKNDISVILAEVIFRNLKKDYKSLPLFELAETSSGGTPNRANQSYYGGKIPWFKSGELNDSIITMSEEFITEEGLNNSSAKVFPKGTLLVAMYGATAGKTAILDIDAATNQAICAVFPRNKSIRKDFLFWFLRAHRYYYIDISRGGAQPNISQTVIKNTEVPLIDENEQKRIVEFLTRIEKTKEINYSLIPKQLHKTTKLAFEHLDCLQKLENENLNQSSYFSLLRQFILQEAIEGKLTAEWRKQNLDLISGDNHASKLLEKIKAEKERLIKEGKIKKDSSRAQSTGKPLPPIADVEKPFDLPEGWVWCRLGELIRISSGGGLTSKEMAKGGKYPVFGGNGINGFHDKYNVTKKTIVIGRVGAQCGSIHVTPEKAWVTDNAFILFFSEKFLYERWLEKLLVALNLRDRARETAQPVISGKRVYPIVTGLPSLAEQQAIVERVDKLMAMIDELKEQVSERKDQAEMLMQSVLREAFAK